MTALKNVYARLIERAGTDTAKIADLKIKIGTSFAVDLLTDDEQLDLITSMPAATTTASGNNTSTTTGGSTGTGGQ